MILFVDPFVAHNIAKTDVDISQRLLKIAKSLSEWHVCLKECEINEE